MKVRNVVGLSVLTAGAAVVGGLFYRYFQDRLDEEFESGYDVGYRDCAEGNAYDGDDPDLQEKYGWESDLEENEDIEDDEDTEGDEVVEEDDTEEEIEEEKDEAGKPESEGSPS